MTLAVDDSPLTAAERAREAADLRVIVGSRLAEHRRIRGVSQAEAARRAGCTQPSMHNYEAGKRNIPLLYMLRLARFYRLTLDQLVDAPSQDVRP